MKMRKLLALLLALVMTMALVACGGSDDEAADDGAADATEAADTLVVYSSGAFQGAWDPTKNSILSNKHLEYQVLDCLLNYDAEGNLTPNMAKSWEYLEDGYTLRIYLNEGIKFHDGSDLTAEDVVATMVYMTRADSARFADYGCQFEGAVVDDYTVDIWPSNQTPLAALLTLLAHDPILSSADIEAGTLDAGINGTGPYKFVKYENETCYLEANENYWNPEKAAKIPMLSTSTLLSPPPVWHPSSPARLTSSSVLTLSRFPSWKLTPTSPFRSCCLRSRDTSSSSAPRT